jgi:Zn-finger nucleic acid-binding protein
MKTCPACSGELVRTTYEKLPVFYCTGCAGHMVSSARLESIQRRTDTSQQALEEEAKGVQIQDERSERGAISCPKCAVPMLRETRSGGLEVEIDRCGNCDVVWLDPGEIAMLQLAYEASPKFKNAEAIRQRYDELQADPERLARFEHNVERLPSGSSSLLGAFGEGLSHGLQIALDSLFWSTLH